MGYAQKEMYCRNHSGKRRGRRGRENKYSDIKIRRPIRADLWAYELIVSSCIETPDSSGKGSSYYHDPRWLLQLLYPHCYQHWARFLRGQGYIFEDPTPSRFERNYDYTNGECFQSDDNEMETKNLILLSTVADTTQRYGCNGAMSSPSIPNGFHHDQDSLNTGIKGNYMSEESGISSKDMLPFNPAVNIKNEDDSMSSAYV